MAQVNYHVNTDMKQMTACYGTAKHRGPNEDITGELRCPWHRSSKPSQNKLADYRDKAIDVTPNATLATVLITSPIL